MSDLTSIEKIKLEKLFDMGGGYVLDFSNRTFGEFFLDNMKIDIWQSRYDYASGSKANRLRGFWKVEGNYTVGNLLANLLDYWKLKREISNQSVTLAENALYEECRRISERLLNNTPSSTSSSQKAEEKNNKTLQLNLLLKMFDEQAISSDHQKRGFFLQDLLNRLFLLNEIPTKKSFQRNDNGEQIDGAFIFQNWYYIVECKWTKKLADIRELDSLLGKVNRSGKQTMGLFLSIEGWSENVPLLLKQNPDKSIVLTEGYDLRCVLSGALELDTLLNAKLSKLNLESEPYVSARDILDGS